MMSKLKEIILIGVAVTVFVAGVFLFQKSDVIKEVGERAPQTVVTDEGSPEKSIDKVVSQLETAEESQAEEDLVSFVAVDTSEDAYTVYTGISHAQLKEAQANVDRLPNVVLVSMDEFKKNVAVYLASRIIINTYKNQRTIPSLVSLIEHAPGTQLGLAWNGGMPFTFNDYQHARREYKSYLEDPDAYGVDLQNPQSDPINPENHLNPLVGGRETGNEFFYSEYTAFPLKRSHNSRYVAYVVDETESPKIMLYDWTTHSSRELMSLFPETQGVNFFWSPNDKVLALVVNSQHESYITEDSRGTKLFVLQIDKGNLVQKDRYNFKIRFECHDAGCNTSSEDFWYKNNDTIVYRTWDGETPYEAAGDDTLLREFTIDEEEAAVSEGVRPEGPLVAIDTFFDAYTGYSLIPADKLEEFESNFAEDAQITFVGFDDFKLNADTYVGEHILFDEYPDFDMAPVLIQWFKDLPGAMFILAWNGGLLITWDHNTYAAKQYEKYVQDPIAYKKADRDPEDDPIDPQHHLQGLLDSVKAGTVDAFIGDIQEQETKADYIRQGYFDPDGCERLQELMLSMCTIVDEGLTHLYGDECRVFTEFGDKDARPFDGFQRLMSIKRLKYGEFWREHARTSFWNSGELPFWPVENVGTEAIVTPFSGELKYNDTGWPAEPTDYDDMVLHVHHKDSVYRLSFTAYSESTESSCSLDQTADIARVLLDELPY